MLEQILVVIGAIVTTVLLIRGIARLFFRTFISFKALAVCAAPAFLVSFAVPQLLRGYMGIEGTIFLMTVLSLLSAYLIVRYTDVFCNLPVVEAASDTGTTQQERAANDILEANEVLGEEICSTSVSTAELAPEGGTDVGDVSTEAISVTVVNTPLPIDEPMPPTDSHAIQENQSDTVLENEPVVANEQQVEIFGGQDAFPDTAIAILDNEGTSEDIPEPQPSMIVDAGLEDHFDESQDAGASSMEIAENRAELQAFHSLEEALDFSFSAREQGDIALACAAIDAAKAFCTADMMTSVSLELEKVNLLRRQGSYLQALTLLADLESRIHNWRHADALGVLKQVQDVTAHLRITEQVLHQQGWANQPIAVVPESVRRLVEAEYKNWRQQQRHT